MSRRNTPPDPRAVRDSVTAWLARGRAVVSRLMEQTSELKRHAADSDSPLHVALPVDRLEDLHNHLDAASAAFVDVYTSPLECDLPDPLAPLRAAGKGGAR